MNTSETADEREASCAASGRLFGRLLSREFVSAVTWDISSFVGDVPGRRLHGKGSRGVYTGIIGEMGQ